MSCNQYKDKLSEYQEGDLPKEQMAEIEAHLKQCRQCRNDVKLFHKMQSLTDQLPHHEPGMDVILKIKAAFQPRPHVERTEFGPVLDFDELSAYLRVSREILGQYLDEIPSFELGGKLLFRRKSVEAWIERKEISLSGESMESEINRSLAYHFINREDNP